jgi:hypothetical protein
MKTLISAIALLALAVILGTATNAVLAVTATRNIAITVTGAGGLPRHFGLGLKNAQGELSWMTGSGVPWDYRYQYITPGWESWNSPSGSFVKNYAQQGYIPVFSWDVIGGGPWGNPGLGLFTTSGIQSTSNMNAYYSSFVLALQNAAASGAATIVFHIEPDLWGWMQQQYGDDPTVIPVSVASSGYAGLGALPNNASGFAKALVQLRNTYAPKVLLGWDNSVWAANNGYTPTNGLLDNCCYNSPVATAQRVATFYSGLAAPFDLIVFETIDRDSGFATTVCGQSSATAWWNDAAFTSYHDYVNTIYAATGLVSIMWQTPVGNTLYRTENNTNLHYQDNRPEYFLKAGNSAHINSFLGAGVVAVLFGNGQQAPYSQCDSTKTDTDYQDYAGDGITNPAPIIGNPFTGTANNTLTATVSDDDGGFLRSAAAAYYAGGAIPW